MDREKTIKNAQECYESLISARIEIALLRLSESPEYKRICSEEEHIDMSLDSLKTNNHYYNIVKQYFDILSIKSHIELNEVYAQGIRDCIKFIEHLHN